MYKLLERLELLAARSDGAATTVAVGTDNAAVADSAIALSSVVSVRLDMLPPQDVSRDSYVRPSANCTRHRRRCRCRTACIEEIERAPLSCGSAMSPRC